MTRTNNTKQNLYMLSSKLSQRRNMQSKALLDDRRCALESEGTELHSLEAELLIFDPPLLLY